MKKKWKNPGAERNSSYAGLYRSWKAIFKRVGNKDGIHPTYSDVTVCDRWFSYDNFFEDMADTWFNGATIDKDTIKPGNRIYCKEYCKWITKSENVKERNERIGRPNPTIRPEIKIKISGSNNYKSKKVKCIETGKIYDCCKDAECDLKLYISAVSNAANPKRREKTAGGYHWEYI